MRPSSRTARLACMSVMEAERAAEPSARSSAGSAVSVCGLLVARLRMTVSHPSVPGYSPKP